jgi:glucosamine-6-phosphate deaminase
MHGTAGEVNGLVFNRLGARIRGRSKLPAGRRIVCFSPHPDDDVISMGGTLRKLVLNRNDITVAMTAARRVFDQRAPIPGLARARFHRGLDATAVLALRVYAPSPPSSRATSTRRKFSTSSARYARRRR